MHHTHMRARFAVAAVACLVPRAFFPWQLPWRLGVAGVTSKVGLQLVGEFEVTGSEPLSLATITDPADLR